MSSTIIKMKRDESSSLIDLSRAVGRDLSGDMVSPEFSCREITEINDTKVMLMIMEKYFMRNGSMAVVSLEVIDSGEDQTAIIVGTGGGQGLLNLSFGANGDFALRVAEALKKCGFSKI